MMEDFVASNQVHIINEERTLKTFQGSRGESNIDLTIAKNKILANIQKWDIADEESASDHDIIKFNITSVKDEGRVTHDPGRLRIKEYQYAEFYGKLQRISSEIFQFENRGRSNENLDETLTQKLEASREVREFTEKLEEVIQKASMETRGNGIKAKQKEEGKTCHGGRMACQD